MSNQDEHEPPASDAEDGEPPDAAMPPANDDSTDAPANVGAAESQPDDERPETSNDDPAPARWWTRLRSERGRRSSGADGLVRYTALISAGAALFGALIGAGASYLVAKSNSADQAAAAQITRRQSTYAEFLNTEIDRRDFQLQLANELAGRTSTSFYYGPISFQAYEQLRNKAVKVEYIVSLDDSREVEQCREDIRRRQKSIDLELRQVYGQASSRVRSDKSRIDKLIADINNLDEPLSKFSAAARNDLLPSPGGIFS